MNLSEAVYRAGPDHQTPAPFQIVPLIALTGRKTTFRLQIKAGYRPVSRWGVTGLEMISDDGVLPDGTLANWAEFARVPFEIIGHELVFDAVLPAEGPHVFRIRCGERTAMLFRLYALEKDLYGLVPLKGDTHLHSFYSDGHQDPPLSAIRGRRRGDDFLALTDHQVYEGSLAAIEALKDSGTGLLLCPGEELHLPQRPEFIRPYHDIWHKLPWVERAIPIHLVNFGGRFSVNDYAYSNPDRYFREIAAYEKNLPQDLPPVDRFCCAAAEWAFDKIREGGGLAVYPHPYWRAGSRRAVTEAMHQTLMARGKFDAFETVNTGCDHDFNMVAMAEYSRQCALGRRYAVLGGADGHNADRDDGWPYTIVLAENLSKEAIIEAVRKHRSCSVMPEDARPPIVTGEVRLVRLAYFLLKFFFPDHDEACALEGRLLEAAYQSPSPLLNGAVTEAANRVAACRAAVYGSGVPLPEN